jgi:PhzF family phenazine biosynthesis protein
MLRQFRQVDVFTDVPYAGNPVAVVLDAGGLDDATMRAVARWTNLSETTFVLPATEPRGDYRVRIFTPTTELPFAGHPTLGTCHAWLTHGGTPQRPDEIVQECAAGLVPLRRTATGLAFAAPPLLRAGPVADEIADEVVSAMGLERAAVRAVEWVDNGPGWIAVLLDSAAAVLAVRPGFVDRDVGLVGPYPAGSTHAIEVRAFFPKDGALVEDPVTGSLNASVAQWLIGTGRLTSPYVASQGTVLGRSGRVHISLDGDTVWVAGGTITCIEGTIEL